MKIHSNILTFLPNARIVVTKTGVKTFGTDTVSGSRVSVNISRQQHRYNLIEQIWTLGLGKQYQ